MPARPHERIIPRFDVVVPRSAVVHAESRVGAGCIARVQGDTFAQPEVLSRRDAVLPIVARITFRDLLFLDAILSAAYDARRLLRRLAVFTQGADIRGARDFPRRSTLRVSRLS